MPLIIYPIILVVSIIIFYILGRKSGARPETIKTVEVTKEAFVLTYENETEESYLIRCQNFIVTFLNDINAPYLVAPDHSYYHVEVSGHQDYHNKIRIEPYFGGGSKYIAFETCITTSLIPNDKLPQLSELINRVNNELMFSGLSLDYENRAINYRITYKVGDQSLIPEYFWFNLKAVNAAVMFHTYINRVLINNEEPVLVALDYLSH
jgi:hypothetical protein